MFSEVFLCVVTNVFINGTSTIHKKLLILCDFPDKCIVEAKRGGTCWAVHKKSV